MSHVREKKPGAARTAGVRGVPLFLSVDASGSHVSVVHRGELRLLPCAAAATAAAATSTEPLCASAVECARFDRAGTQLLSGGADKVVRLWDTASRACVRSWTHNKKIACVEFSPDGDVVMFADRFGEVYTVALREPDAEPSLALGHLSPVSHLRLSACGTALLTADREGHVRSSLWPNPFVIQRYYLTHTQPLQLVLPMASSPLLLTCADSARELCVWGLHSSKQLHASSAAALQAVCEGRAVAAASSAAAAGNGEKQQQPAKGEEEGEEAAEAALEVACECAAQGLLLLGFGTAALHVLAMRCGWEADAVEFEPLPALQLQLPSPALAADCTAGGSLCVLVSSGVLVFPPAAAAPPGSKRARDEGALGFDQASATLVPLGFIPDMSSAAADAADDGDDGDMAD